MAEAELCVTRRLSHLPGSSERAGVARFTWEPKVHHRSSKVETAVSVGSGERGAGRMEAEQQELVWKMTTDLNLCPDLEINDE